MINILSKIKSVLLIVPNVMKAMKLISVIDDIKNVIAETLEAIEKTKAFMNKLKGVAKQQFVEVIVEWDEVLESLANVCAKVPYFKKYEKKIRDLIDAEDYR